MPLLTKKQQIAIKQEAVAGTKETLVAADVLLHTELASFDPDIQIIPREGMSATLSRRGNVRGSQAAKISFKMFARGTTGAPLGGNESDYAIAFRGCGLDAVYSGADPNEIGTWKPDDGIISDETTGSYCTVGLFEDGKLSQIHGAVGNLIWTLTKAQPVLLGFEFTGLYDDPVDAALLVPTYSTVVEPPFKDASLSILGFASAKLESLTLDLGNTITMRPSPNGPTGFLSAQISARDPKGSFDVEEELAATQDFFAALVAGTLGAITTGLFPSSGANFNQFILTIPNAELTGVSPTDREGIRAVQCEYSANANTDAGEDEFTWVQD